MEEVVLSQPFINIGDTLRMETFLNSFFIYNTMMLKDKWIEVVKNRVLTGDEVKKVYQGNL